MKFVVGNPVQWRSSNLRKEGVVVAVVPAGRLPKDVGFPMVGKGSLSRSVESYVLKGGPKDSKREDFFWPVVSVIEPATGLTADEVRWCHVNAEAVRALIAKTKP